MTRALLAATALATAMAGAAAQTMIRSPTASAQIDLVEHVDVLPDHMAQAKDAIAGYVQAARREPGALQIDAMQEVRQNHFDVVEVWHDETAYRDHLSSPATLRFRDTISPWLGSPFDERLGTPLLR